MTAWHLGPLCVFDTETTGVDVENDRIVTATVADIPPGSTPAARSWLIAVDVDIPAEATAVHGITSEHAWEHGDPAPDVIDAVAEHLTMAMAAGIPVVVMNGSFDFTIHDRELRRHGLATLDERLARPIGPVIDIFVIDKAADRYRRGGRKLVDLCTTYQVKHGGAHDATEDALAAGRVAGRLAQRYPRIAAMDLDELHAAQVRWAAEQATSFRQYLYREANQRLHRVDDTTSVEAGDLARQDADQLRTRAEAVDGAWPLRAHPAAVGGGR